MRRRHERLILSAVLLSDALVLSVPGATLRARGQEPATTEGQPLAANVERVVRALESLGARCRPRPWPRWRKRAGNATASASRTGSTRTSCWS